MGTEAFEIRTARCGPHLAVVVLLAGAALLTGCTGPSGDSSGSLADLPALAWAAREGPGRVADVIDVEGRLVAVGAPVQADASGAGQGEIAQAWTSPDGRTWETAALDGDGRMVSVTRAEGGSLVAVGSWTSGSGVRAAAWSSPDGASWTRIDGGGEFDPAAGCASTQLEDVVAGPSGFVAVGTEWGEGSCGQHAAAWWSADGVTWARAEVPGGHAMHAVVQTRDGFTAAGADTAAPNEGARAAAWWSSDGQAWTQADESSFQGAEIKALAVSTRGVAAVGYAFDRTTGALEPAAWRSADGQTWTRDDEETFTGPPAGASAPSGAITMAYADGLVATDAGLIATGVSTASTAGADGGASGFQPWRYQVWTQEPGEPWTRLPDAGAPIAGDGSIFTGGPRAIIFGERLLLFGTVPEPPAADAAPATASPPAKTASVWDLDALVLGLGSGVLMNAWWKDAGGGMAAGPVVDAGGPLSARNCPTLEEVRAAVPAVIEGPDANPEPFKGQVLLCSYTIGELNVDGRPALVSIEVFDASVEDIESWGSANEDPANPTAIPGLGESATAKGQPAHEVLWVRSGPWALKLANSRHDGIPLDQMIALARLALTSVALPPR